MPDLKAIAMAALVGAASAFGATSVEEPFAYSVGNLGGGSGGAGFSAGWGTPTATGPGTATVGAASPSAGALATSGGSAILGAAKDGSSDGNVLISRTLSTPLTSNSDGSITVQPYYISFIADLDDALFSEVSDAGQRQWGTSVELRLVDSVNNKVVTLGKLGGSATWGFGSTNLPGAGLAGTAISDSPTLIVLKVTPSSWNVTNFNLWVNPAELGGAEPTAGTTASTNQGFSFTELQLSAAISGWLPSSSGTLNHSIDEIRVGSDWADVTPVPEPAMIGSLALAGIALLRRRTA